MKHKPGSVEHRIIDQDVPTQADARIRLAWWLAIGVGGTLELCCSRDGQKTAYALLEIDDSGRIHACKTKQVADYLGIEWTPDAQ